MGIFFKLDSDIHKKTIETFFSIGNPVVEFLQKS